jgi:hypothetical protein
MFTDKVFEVVVAWSPAGAGRAATVTFAEPLRLLEHPVPSVTLVIVYVVFVVGVTVRCHEFVLIPVSCAPSDHVMLHGAVPASET